MEGFETRGKVFRVFDEDPALGIESPDSLIFISDEKDHVAGIRNNKLICKLEGSNRRKRLFNLIILLPRI